MLYYSATFVQQAEKQKARIFSHLTSVDKGFIPELAIVRTVERLAKTFRWVLLLRLSDLKEVRVTMSY